MKRNRIAGTLRTNALRADGGTTIAQPKKKSKKGTMTVNPPLEVGSVLGGFKTTTLTQAVRIAAQILGDAAEQVGGMFSDEEWWVLAESHQERSIEPETPTPGYVMARLVERAQSRYEVASKFGEDVKAQQAALKSLVKRLENLTYLQAWATLIACEFYHAYRDAIPDGAKWWKIVFRRSIIKPKDPA